MRDHLATRLAVHLARLAICYPWTTVLLGGVAAAALLTAGSVKLEYRTERAALQARAKYAKESEELLTKEFGGKDDIVVTVQGSERQLVMTAMDDLAKAFCREGRQFQAVLHQIDRSKLCAKRLYWLSVAQLQAIQRFCEETTPILHDGWTSLSAENLLGSLLLQRSDVQAGRSPQSAETVEDRLVQFAQSLSTALTLPEAFDSPWPDLAISTLRLSESPPSQTADSPQESDREGYLLSADGKTGFVLLQLREDQKAFVQNGEGMEALQQIVDTVGEKHGKVTIGLTGWPVMEYQEIRSTRNHWWLAMIVSMAGLGLVSVVGLGGIRHPLVVLLVVLVGLGWSLGGMLLAVRHLTLWTSTLGAFLIAVAGGQALHFVARYKELRREGKKVHVALIDAAATVGPTIATGAFCIAVALAMVSWTHAAGMAELGISAGAGVLGCSLAVLTVLPALVCLADRWQPDRAVSAPLGWVHTMSQFIARSHLVLHAGLVLTVLVVVGIKDLCYDDNLLEIQPVGLPGVALDQQLLTEINQSTWFAVSLAKTPEEALARKAKLLQLPSVERVDEIDSLLPRDGKAKQPVVQQIAKQLARLPVEPAQIPVAEPSILALRLRQSLDWMANSPRAKTFRQAVESICQCLAQISRPDYFARISQYQQQVAGDLLDRLRWLQTASNPQPPTRADLPAGLVSRFVGSGGQRLLKIYAKENTWNLANLESFVREVRSVDPNVTGTPVALGDTFAQPITRCEQAIWYTLALALSAVLFLLRRVSWTMVAVVAPGVGLLQTVGLLGLAHIPLNPVNLAALVLILGIGLDCGIHLVNDFRRQRGSYRTSPATVIAVSQSALVLMIGLLAVMLTDDRGLRSLGRTVTVGLTCILPNTLVLIPAVLRQMFLPRAIKAARRTPSVEQDDFSDEGEIPPQPIPIRKITRRDAPQPKGPAATTVTITRRPPPSLLGKSARQSR